MSYLRVQTVASHPARAAHSRRSALVTTYGRRSRAVLQIGRSVCYRLLGSG